MKQFIVGVLLTIAGFALWACCPKGHLYIEFVNKADYTIAFDYSTECADTSFCCDNWYGRMILDGIRPDSSYMLKSSSWRDGWEGELKDGVLDILVADRGIWSQYRKEPCDTIRKYVPILHHYRLTVEDLDLMKWKVVYPPIE